MSRILYLVTEDWYFCSHRLSLALAARNAGHEVIVVTQIGNHANTIRSEGFNLIPVVFPRSLRRPWQDIGILISILKIYRRVRPDIVHHIALKPVIYGSIMAIFAGRNNPSVIINALTGLGYVFTSHKLSARIIRALVSPLLRFLLHNQSTHLIIQNGDDMEMLMRRGFVNPGNVSLIRGSGVDIQVFKPNPVPAGVVTVMLVARMLKEKGVEEFVSGASQLVNRGLQARFVLVGDIDKENPSAIPVTKLRQWDSERIVEWWGKHEDMIEVYKQAHIVVLPSYREGLPKVLLEAAACGLPIVASDVPGCREIVNHGKNGLLIPAKNSDALADAIYRLIMDPELRKKMGARGRALVEHEFSSEKIINETLILYDNLLNKHTN